MAGYYGYSMSNNAVMAYYNGEKPLSKWTKTELVRAIREENFPDMDTVKKMTVSELRRVFLRRSSWHHTGKLYNVTDFYSVNVDGVTVDQLREIIADREPATKPEKPKPVKAFVRFGEWEGSRRHMRLVYDGCYAVIVGNVAYLEDGRKKRTDGKHFAIVEKYERSPKGTAATFKKIMGGLK